MPASLSVTVVFFSFLLSTWLRCRSSRAIAELRPESKTTNNPTTRQDFVGPFTPSTAFGMASRQTLPSVSSEGPERKRPHKRGFLKSLKKKLKKFKKHWKMSKKEARKLFDKYYECTEQKLEELKKEDFRIKAVLALEGESVKMTCTVCYRPDQPKAGQEAQWQFLKHEDTGLRTLAPGKSIKIRRDNSLIIKDIDINDAGQYFCLEKHDYAAVYQVDVFLRDLRRFVVFGLDQLQNETYLPGRNLRVFTMWSVWGKCNTCGRPGHRKRVGQCTVKKLFPELPLFPRDYPLMSLYPEGVPCHSTALPRHIRQLPEIGKRFSETLVKSCEERCQTPPPQITVTDEDGEVIDVLEPGYYPIDKKPKLPSPVRRKVLYEQEGTHLVVHCPTKREIQLVRWMRGEREVDPSTIQRQTKGRVKVDSQNRLHMNPLLLSDTAVYDCWKKNRRVAAIKVLVVEAENQQVKLYISYAGFFMTVGGSATFLCCMCCKKSDKSAR